MKGANRLSLALFNIFLLLPLQTLPQNIQASDQTTGLVHTNNSTLHFTHNQPNSTQSHQPTNQSAL